MILWTMDRDKHSDFLDAAPNGTSHGRKGKRFEYQLDFVGDYPLDWDCVAWNVKQEAGWRCEHCGHVHDTAAGYMLGVHHLDMDKGNCDWGNLVALCQRCHLRIQARYSPLQMWLWLRPTWAVIRGVGAPIYD